MLDQINTSIISNWTDGNDPIRAPGVSGLTTTKSQKSTR
jgi:hypothetical protein